MITAGICDRRNGAGWSFCVATILRTECPLRVKSGHRSKSAQCLLCPQKRTSELSHRMSALCGVFNRSTQHLLILLEEEVCDGGDCTDIGSRRSRGLSFGSAGRTVNVWRISRGRLSGGTREPLPIDYKRCCTDRLSPPPKADIRRSGPTRVDAGFHKPADVVAIDARYFRMRGHDRK